MPDKLSVLPAGDFELWTVTSKLPDGFAFTLPIKARPFSVEGSEDTNARIWFVHRGMLLSSSQYNALTPVLDAFDFSPDDERGWWFKNEDMARFAVKVPGMNPEYYIVWPGVEPLRIHGADASPDQVVVEPAPGFSGPELTFLKKLHHAIPEISWDALKIFWLAIRKEAIRWVAVEKKPLDLGFIKLIPMPYRANWKEALAVRFGSLIHVFRKPTEERHQDLTVCGFYSALASPKLLAIDRDKNFIDWTIEMIPSDEMTRTAQQHEHARRQKIGPGSYASNMLQTMAAHLNATLDIMKFYAGRISIPPASAREGKTFVSTVLLPAVQLGRVRPGRGICDRIDLAPNDAFGQFNDEEWLRPEKDQFNPPVPKLTHKFRSRMIEFSPNDSSTTPSQDQGNGHDDLSNVPPELP